MVVPAVDGIDLFKIAGRTIRLPTPKDVPFAIGYTFEGKPHNFLAALEMLYRELFPQLNLRQWSGAIYIWLTNPVLDPTNSGRVTMDSLMKLVTTALEWSYEAKDVNQRFQESGVDLVECPDCASTRTLSPHGGVLRFKSHEKRKTNTPNTGPRWVRVDLTWSVVRG